jgi:hypothetical protein
MRDDEMIRDDGEAGFLGQGSGKPISWEICAVRKGQKIGPHVDEQR